jgi:hypothetical protein
MIWTDKEADTEEEELNPEGGADAEKVVVVEGETKAETKEAVEAGAVEAALEVGREETDKPPTVIVEGDTKSSSTPE